jgi:hypothetical protein
MPVPATNKPTERAYKPKRTLKAPAVQSAILAKRANGHSKAKISKELGIAVNTVTNVLELNDFDRTLQSEQKESLKLIPRAIGVMHDRLTKGSENAAIHVLENTIWPLNAKQTKQSDPSLTLAIQNLMGNVQIAAPAQAKSDTAQVSEAANQEPIDVAPAADSERTEQKK